MSFINEVGVALGFTNNKGWRLVSLDDPRVRIVGQFIAQELTENVGADIGGSKTLGSQQVSKFFLGGDSETITFRARIFRTSPIKGAIFDALSNPVGTGFAALSGGTDAVVGDGSVRSEIEKLKASARAVDTNGNPNPMGRPHRYLFTVGTELEFEVFVKSVGGIVYDELRSDGTLRGATFSMQLEKIKLENLRNQSEAGVSTAAKLKSALGIITGVSGALGLGQVPRANLINIPGGSLHTTGRKVRVKPGMSFESIARTEYGNPLLGDVLRRAQPEKANLQLGDEVTLVKREEIVQIPVTQQSVALKDSTDNKALVDFYLDQLGGSSTVII